ncbi:MAG: prolyl hydroxylase family protein [Thermaurantiacus tibetensis]|uniref:prolyl hydroxylase family protein n=1 Tax=Thermaurantiacus tibetensis TaxID=2759035 RepID=UPI00188FBDA4
MAEGTEAAVATDPAPAPFAGCQKVPDRRLTLYIRRNFLDPETCAALVHRIDADRRPSLVADSNGDPFYRTSETCMLDPQDPLVARVDAMLDAIAGQPHAHGEQIQGQRYGPGQEFRWHTDYYEPDGPDFERFCRVGGQRTWTLMVYLDVPEEGGATRFRRINKTIQPETGKLVAWHNLDARGRPNFETLHAGMKVYRGVKHVITKWYRERPLTA